MDRRQELDIPRNTTLRYIYRTNVVIITLKAHNYADKKMQSCIYTSKSPF